MTVEIEGPDGSINEFPDGTPDDVIAKAMRAQYGGPQAAPAAPAGPSLAQRAEGAVGGALAGAASTVENVLGIGPRRASPAYQQSSDLDAMMRGQAPAPAEPPKPPPTMGERGGGLVRGALGVADQGVRGIAEGAADLVGLPVDATTAFLNRDPDVQNIRRALGLGDKPITTPFLGSDSIKGTLNYANDRTVDLANAVLPERPAGGPALSYPQREPDGPIERIANRTGKELGAMAVPVGFGLGAASALGREGVKELPALARMFAEPASVNPGKFVTKEALAAGGAGAGAGVANEITRAAGADQHGLAHAGGDLAGALAGLGVVGGGAYALSKGGDIVKAITGSPSFRNQVTNDRAVDILAEAYGLPSARMGAAEPTDVSPIIDAINRGPKVGDTIPGYRESLADRTGNTGLAGLEYSRETANSGTFAERRRANTQAVDDALQAAAPEGSPGAFRQEMSNNRDLHLRNAAEERQGAQARFDEAAQRLQAVMHADARGADIRAPLEDALAAARDVERGAWSGVSEGSADITPLVEGFRGVRNGLSQAEQQVFDPQHLTSIPQRFMPAPVEPAADAAQAAARSGMDGMNAEERAMAESLFRPSPPAPPAPPVPATPAAAPAAAAPSLNLTDLPFRSAPGTEDRIMQAVQGLPVDQSRRRTGSTGGVTTWDLRAALPDMSEADLTAGLFNLQAKGHGNLSQLSDPRSIPRDAYVANVAGRHEDRHLFYPNSESVARVRAQPAAPEAPSTPAPRGEPPPEPAPPTDPAPPEPVNVPLSEATGLRSALTDAQRAAASAGEHNRARVIGQYVDAVDSYFAQHHPDQSAYDNARAVTRDLNDRFTRPQTDVAQTLDRNQGQYRMPDNGVSRRFVRPDEGNQGGLEALIRETGADARSRGAIEDQVRADVSRLRTPEAVDAYVRDHSRVFEQFPRLREQIQEASGLQRGAAAATANERDAISRLGAPGNEQGTSSVGRYLRYGDEASETAMKGVLNSPRPAEAANELLDFAGNAPHAVEGARRTFWDLLEKQARSRGETTASLDGVQPWMPKKLARFLDEPRNAAVAERLYRDDPEQLTRVREIADALKNTNLRGRAKAPNSSGTAQGLQGGSSNIMTPETIQSRLYAYKRGQVSGTFLVTSLAAVAARRGIAKSQAEAITKLVDEALTNPEAAKTLLLENNPANRAVLARRAKGYVGEQASQIVDALNDNDPDPVKDALRRARP
jgi:hypothetical protein